MSVNVQERQQDLYWWNR